MSFREVWAGFVYTDKEHSCTLCGEVIPPNTTAAQKCWLEDGCMVREWRHLDCDEGAA